MSKHLEAKLGTLLNEIEQLSTSDQKFALIQFIKSEVNLMEMTHNWNERDLAVIRSYAIQIMQNLSSSQELEGHSLYSNNELIRTYCFAQATYLYMRSLSMTPYVVGIQAEKLKKPACEHEKAEMDPFDGITRCLKCKVEVKALAWIPVKPKN